MIDFLQSPLSPMNCGKAKDAPILIPTVSTARALLESKRAQGAAILIASGVRFQKMFTHWPCQNFFDELHGQWWWVTTSPQTMSSLRVYSHDFVKLFGGLMHQHGASINLPPSPIVSVSMYPHSFSKYFTDVVDAERRIRAEGLRAKWNFKTKRMNTRFEWTSVPRSWDTVNKSLQWSNCKLGRPIHMWRMIEQSVSESGSRIYALWIPGYNKVYIGQTGARGVFRSVFDRGREHIIQARDWALMHEGKRAAVPLYDWIAKHGFERVVMTPLERVQPWQANTREVFWMHRFGKSRLLNRAIPDARLPKWSWLLKTKSFLSENKKSTSEKEAIIAKAKHFVQCMHSSLSVAEKLRLVFDSKKFCESGLASQVFVKARKHIKRDTGVVIRRQFLVKVPMMDHTLKNTLHGIIAGEIARDPKAPTALKDYLVSCITLVRQKTPTVGDLCKSFQLRVPTDDVHSACNTPLPCECAHLAEKYGVPLVDGHCVTRDFTWLSDYSAGADPAALTQNLKNALLPQWHRVRDEVHSNLRKTLRDIPILSNKEDLSLSVMAAIQGFYQNLVTTTPTTHHLSHVKKQLKRLPPSWVTGWFDKGTSALWAGCKNFWYPRFQKAFFQQPKRFSELLRTPSPADASEQAFRYIPLSTT